MSHFRDHLWVSVAPSMCTLFSGPVGHGHCGAHFPSRFLALSISINLFFLFVNGSVTNGFLKMKTFMIYKTRLCLYNELCFFS